MTSSARKRRVWEQIREIEAAAVGICNKHGFSQQSLTQLIESDEVDARRYLEIPEPVYYCVLALRLLQQIGNLVDRGHVTAEDLLDKGYELAWLHYKFTAEDRERFEESARQRGYASRPRKKKSLPRDVLSHLGIRNGPEFRSFVGDGVVVENINVKIEPVRDDSGKVIKYYFEDNKSGSFDVMKHDSVTSTIRKIRK